ncbi:MAG: hypothetical protein AAF288_01350 [Planctomycetota bacterium]
MIPGLRRYFGLLSDLPALALALTCGLSAGCALPSIKPAAPERLAVAAEPPPLRKPPADLVAVVGAYADRPWAVMIPQGAPGDDAVAEVLNIAGPTWSGPAGAALSLARSVGTVDDPTRQDATAAWSVFQGVRFFGPPTPGWVREARREAHSAAITSLGDWGDASPAVVGSIANPAEVWGDAFAGLGPAVAAVTFLGPPESRKLRLDVWVGLRSGTASRGRIAQAVGALAILPEARSALAPRLPEGGWWMQAWMRADAAVALWPAADSKAPPNRAPDTSADPGALAAVFYLPRGDGRFTAGPLHGVIEVSPSTPMPSAPPADDLVRKRTSQLAQWLAGLDGQTWGYPRPHVGSPAEYAWRYTERPDDDPILSRLAPRLGWTPNRLRVQAVGRTLDRYDPGAFALSNLTLRGWRGQAGGRAVWVTSPSKRLLDAVEAAAQPGGRALGADQAPRPYGLLGEVRIHLPQAAAALDASLGLFVPGRPWAETLGEGELVLRVFRAADATGSNGLDGPPRLRITLEAPTATVRGLLGRFGRVWLPG